MQCGPKAATLAQLRQHRFNVPAGFVIPWTQVSQIDTTVLANSFDRLTPPVAVRSSALGEDSADASFAGIQETVLHVNTFTELQQAIKTVVTAAASDRAQFYQADIAPQIAVLVQEQVAATVAGAGFTKNPQTGADELLIEAIAGIGDALMSGTTTPQQWRFNADLVAITTPVEPLLTTKELQRLLVLLQTIAMHLGSPQDIEWAWDGKQFRVLQSRPITTSGNWFTNTHPNDNQLWTSAFLNERLTQPVSPLGWTLVARHLETLAFSAPLRLLNASFSPNTPLLKLYRGHPYSRVAAWGRIYKLFPNWLLPADASRFFPNNDAALRYEEPVPKLRLSLLGNAITTLRENFGAASPLHNPRHWQRFTTQLEKDLAHLQEQWQQDQSLEIIHHLVKETDALTAELLEYHRWSLLYADVFWGLANALGGTKHLQAPATITAQLNHDLIALANALDGSRLSMQDDVALDAFLAKYGHRFYSLDIFDPNWAADRAGFRQLLKTLRGSTSPQKSSKQPWRPILRLTYRYLQLREDQRFHWQKIMAFQRTLFVWLGDYLQTQGVLEEAKHVFGLTWEDIQRILATDAPSPALGKVAATRYLQLQQLRQEYKLAPSQHYPDVLRGNTPQTLKTHQLSGRGVSNGLVQGPARIIQHPSDFSRLNEGDILITESPDPGWTPVFNRIAGLVTARGGQLSHGAVLAREYGLPAVFGVPNVTQQLQEHDIIRIDGTTGQITRVSTSKTA